MELCARDPRSRSPGALNVLGAAVVVVEYALRDLDKPIGVAQWAPRLVDALPKELESSLPTIAQIEAELGQDADG